MKNLDKNKEPDKTIRTEDTENTNCKATVTVDKSGKFAAVIRDAYPTDFEDVKHCVTSTVV